MRVVRGITDTIGYETYCCMCGSRVLVNSRWVYRTSRGSGKFMCSYTCYMKFKRLSKGERQNVRARKVLYDPKS